VRGDLPPGEREAPATGGRTIKILAVNTDPCQRCQRLGWDPPWQLVARVTYTDGRNETVRLSLCLSRHLAEFLAEVADGEGSPLTAEDPQDAGEPCAV
jgi:hypothetical protein